MVENGARYGQSGALKPTACRPARRAFESFLSIFARRPGRLETTRISSIFACRAGWFDDSSESTPYVAQSNVSAVGVACGDGAASDPRAAGPC